MNIQPEFKLEQTDIATSLTHGYPYQSLRGYGRLAVEYVTRIMLAKPISNDKQPVEVDYNNEV